MKRDEREWIAAQCRAWAVERFGEHGPEDARGAALWDVAEWLREDMQAAAVHVHEFEPVEITVAERGPDDPIATLLLCRCGQRAEP